MPLPTLLIVSILAQVPAASQPPFSRFPAALVHGPLHLPRIKTAEQRRFRAVLTNAVTKGYGVVEGGTEHERPGPNFAGHFLLVQWGCGLDCPEAAVIDIVDGAVIPLPTPPGRQSPPSFHLETGSSDLRDLRFTATSRLLRIPNVVDGRAYDYVLEGHTWRALAARPNPAN